MKGLYESQLCCTALFYSQCFLAMIELWNFLPSTVVNTSDIHAYAHSLDLCLKDFAAS